MNTGPRTLACLGVLLAACILGACEKKAATVITTESPPLASLLGGQNVEGFAKAEGPRAFSFPEDHAAHPSFRNEWWYVTGNLESKDGRRFGYELTLFRFALAPMAAAEESEWRTNQMYMGHLALSDIDGKDFLVAERFSRGAAQLAGATSEPVRIWLYDWSLRHRLGVGAANSWQLQAKTDDVNLELSLDALKAPILQGETGWSKKSAEGDNASYYYSLPRLRTTGTLRLRDQKFDVGGLSWMDREWSSSALSARQEGWDWFALQLDDGADLMFYQLRQDDGSSDEWSAGSLIEADGSVVPLTRDDVTIEVLDYWDSPLGGRYPHKWRIQIPTQFIDLRVTPALAAQELNTFVRYWEGAVDFLGTRGTTAVAGRGYVELTGYAKEQADQ